MWSMRSRADFRPRMAYQGIDPGACGQADSYQQVIPQEWQPVAQPLENHVHVNRVPARDLSHGYPQRSHLQQERPLGFIHPKPLCPTRHAGTTLPIINSDTIRNSQAAAERSASTCVNVPLDESEILDAFGHAIRCARVSGLEDAAYHAPWAFMELCRPGPSRFPTLKDAPSGMLVRRPHSLDRLPLRSLPQHPAPIRRRLAIPPPPNPCNPLPCTAGRARHTMGHRHSDQHLWLVRQHS